MAGTKVWSNIGNTLAVSVEGDFARKVGPLLRLLEPDLVPTPDRLSWDAAGIDYVDWVEQGPFPCVVQCKGFHVQVLGKQQVEQVRRSIMSFLNSTAACVRYYLVHNRDGRHKEFNHAVNLFLQELVDKRKVQEAIFLDRHSLIKEAKKALTNFIEEDIRSSAASRRRQVAELFSVELPHMSLVPVREGSIDLNRDEPSAVSLSPVTLREDVSQELVRGSSSGWTLLQGSFGAGKTTTAFEAASSLDKTVIVLECSQIPPAASQSLRKALQVSANFDLDFVRQEADRPLIAELAASVLVQLLSSNAAPDKFLLIVDGLDENRIFSRLSGLQSLVNQFADLECAVVLTARSEHFEALFGNYSTALSELSWKYGRTQTINLLHLQPWQRRDILSFLDSAMQLAPTNSVSSLQDLRDLLSSSAEESLYGDIPSNPLLLRFLIDDVASEGLRPRSRSALLRAWARRKFWRDARKRSEALPTGQDISTFVDNVFEATESVAGAMYQESPLGIQLLETITSDTVLPVLSPLKDTDDDPILKLLLHSVLIPASRRTGREIEFRFAFRLFQEFFLASFLAREGIPSAGFPAAVRELADELSG